MADSASRTAASTRSRMPVCAFERAARRDLEVAVARPDGGEHCSADRRLRRDSGSQPTVHHGLRARPRFVKPVARRSRELPPGWEIAKNRRYGLLEAVKRQGSALHVLIGRDRTDLLSRIEDVEHGRKPLWPAWWIYPTECEAGHKWSPGRITVTWSPCNCMAAQAVKAGVAGHLTACCTEPGCSSTWRKPACSGRS